MDFRNKSVRLACVPPATGRGGRLSTAPTGVHECLAAYALSPCPFKMYLKDERQGWRGLRTPSNAFKARSHRRPHGWQGLKCLGRHSLQACLQGAQSDMTGALTWDAAAIGGGFTCCAPTAAPEITEVSHHTPVLV